MTTNELIDLCEHLRHVCNSVGPRILAEGFKAIGEMVSQVAGLSEANKVQVSIRLLNMVYVAKNSVVEEGEEPGYELLSSVAMTAAWMMDQEGIEKPKRDVTLVQSIWNMAKQYQER